MMYRFMEMDYPSREEAEEAVDDFCERNVDDLIDMDYPEGIKIYNLTYDASVVLHKCDVIAYRCIISDFSDAMYDNIEEIEEGEENEQ